MSGSSTKPLSSFQPISSLVYSQMRSQLGDSTPNLAKLHDLQKIWRESLPSNITAHSHIALINEHDIVIYTESPVWANKLTQIQSKLLKILWNKGCVGNQKLIIRVMPSTRIPYKNKTFNARNLSKRASECLRAAAADISDPNLKQALLNLSRQTP